MVPENAGPRMIDRQFGCIRADAGHTREMRRRIILGAGQLLDRRVQELGNPLTDESLVPLAAPRLAPSRRRALGLQDVRDKLGQPTESLGRRQSVATEGGRGKVFFFDPILGNPPTQRA
jgi:hypothetical protein